MKYYFIPGQIACAKCDARMSAKAKLGSGMIIVFCTNQACDMCWEDVTLKLPEMETK